MDFESIYRLQEAEAAPAQVADTGLPPEMTASEEAMNIAMNQLNLVVKNFKNDNYIQTMMDFYDGKNMNESIESNTKHLTEAKKGSFESYYNVIVKSVSNVQKKIKIAVIITIAALILAGIGGTALISTLKNKKAEMNALKENGASGDGASNEGTPANKEAEGTSGDGASNEGTPNEGAAATGTPSDGAAATGTPSDGASTNKETEGNSLADPATQAQVQNQAQEVAANPETVQQSLKPADPQVVKSVINGNFGNAPERAQNLIKAGYDPISVQNAVNADPSAKAAPKAVEETPAPAEVTKVVKQEIESGELKTDGSGKVVPTVKPTGTNTGANAPASSGNGDAYNLWKNNPNNQKMINNLTAQAKAAGQDPEAVMRDTFNNGGTVDALRTVQSKYGLTDISGDGVSDNKMSKTIGAANLDSYKAQQYQQLQNDPEVQAYLNFIKSDKKLGGQSLDVIGKKSTGFGAYTGLSEFKTDPTGNRQAYWTDKPGVTPQIKNGLKKIQAIAKTKKIPQ